MKTNKELKEEYKQLKFKIGVFQIRNKINDKIYIDSSVNLDAFWNRNCAQLNFGNHPNAALQSDWKTFGEDNFVYEILSEIKQKDDEQLDYAKEAKQLAALFIDELKPFDEKGYNKKI